MLENFNLILGIISSVVAIWAAFIGLRNSSKIKKMSNRQVNKHIGNDSVAINSNGNGKVSVNNGGKHK